MKIPICIAAGVVSLASLATADEAAFLSNTRQLVLEGKRSGEGYFSPDGKMLVFQSEREEGNPFYQIYTLDMESGDTVRISPGTGKTTCAFFKPGTQNKQLLLASTHGDPESKARQQAELDFRASGKQRRYSWDYDAAMDIYSVNSDGTGLVNLTHTQGYDAEGSYSPDGKLIAFCSLRGAYGRDLTEEEKSRLEKDPAWFGDIYLMNADGTNVRQLTNAPGYDGGPFFSPDGQRIIWRRFDASGMNADVFSMKLDGTEVRQITDFKSMSWAPFYHPSGDYVIFTSNKLGFENFELFLVDAAGDKEPVRVTFTPGFDGLPVFTPDGKKLAWSTGRTTDGKSQLFIADWNDAAARAALAAAPKRGTATAAAKDAPKPVEAAVPGANLPNIGSLLMKPEISAEDLMHEIGYLANGRHEGRATGTEGGRLAAEWIAEYLKKVGTQPLPGGDGYFHSFEFNAGEKIIADQNSLSLVVKADPHAASPASGPAPAWKLDTDFRPLAFTENGSAEGGVVFAGYGLSVPEAPGQMRYSSYEGLDVKDKVVLLLRYVPEGVDAPRRAHLNRYAGLRYKVMMARERGAKAVLVVTGPNSPGAGELIGLGGDGSSSGSGLPVMSISAQVAETLLASSGKKLKALQDGLDNENPHAHGSFAVPGASVVMKTGVEHIKKTDRNVVGIIPRGVTEGPEEWVFIGAHYDHLGRGKAGGGSLAKSGEEAQIHYGADDNASGTAMVLELAASLAAERVAHPEKFRRNIAFCLWSGEEMGLLGSNSFVEKPPLALANVAAYLNADMVGRLRDNKLIVQGVGSSKTWPRLLEKRNVAAGFSLTVQEDPYLPTDVTAFYPKRIPVLNFFTGSHEDYHRPTDTPDKINTEGLARITKFAQGILLDVASAPERPDFARVERKEQGGGSRDNLRAYLGSIPDYAQEVKGVKLSGVRAGSPAEKAGIKSGDVVVEFAGQKIANIYDYTYALDAVKIGVPVKIVVEREGKQVEILATPEQRK